MAAGSFSLQLLPEPILDQQLLNSGPRAALLSCNLSERTSMARANLKSSPARRSTRSVVRHSPSKSSVLDNIGHIAMSRPARTVYYVLGTAGLAALAVALVGPKRLEREVIKPLRGAL